MIATMADAHREWHLNAGVPMGSAGCPQDACHPAEDFAPEDPKEGLTNPVKCGRCSTRLEPVYHEGVAGIRACSLAGKVETFEPEPAPALPWSDGEPLSLEAETMRGSLQSFEPLYDGLYTIEAPVGHRTFRVRTQGLDEDFAPGKTVLAFQSGPDNNRDYTPFAFVVSGQVRIWSRFKDNAEMVRDAQALVRNPSYALQAAHCIRCHRTLTVPASIHNGYGPECAKKV